MSFESMPYPLSAKFSPVTPLYDRSLLSDASHNAFPLPLPIFTLSSSSQIELPTVHVTSPVRRGKKSSKSLNTNSLLVSSDSSPLLKNLLPHHRIQLMRAWATLPLVPTVNSRRVWAKARNLSPSAVHAWFNTRKRRAKVHNQPIGEGTYDLPVGDPDDGLDINEEIRPDAFLLSPAADSSLSTPSLVPHSPISITSSYVPGSSPPSPTVLAVSVKKPICTKKVAPKGKVAAKPKPSATSFPTGKWIPSMISTAYIPRAVVILFQLESASRKPGTLTSRSRKQPLTHPSIHVSDSSLRTALVPSKISLDFLLGRNAQLLRVTSTSTSISSRPLNPIHAYLCAFLKPKRTIRKW